VDVHDEIDSLEGIQQTSLDKREDLISGGFLTDRTEVGISEKIFS
jgi:hypothetical protein